MNDDIDHHSPVVCGLCVVCRTTVADRKRCLGYLFLEVDTPYNRRTGTLWINDPQCHESLLCRVLHGLCAVTRSDPGDGFI